MIYNTTIIILTVATISAFIAYYLVMIKPDQNEKISKKEKRKGKTDIAPVEPDPYSEIINDYPHLNS